MIGDPNQQIIGSASLAEAQPGEVSFFSDPRYGPLLRKTRASALFVLPDFSDAISLAQIRIANPSKAFEQIVIKFGPKPVMYPPGIHPTAVVDPSAKLGPGVSIQPNVVIEADASVRANLEEMRFLERAIGATGCLAMLPLRRTSSRDIWQIMLLARRR